jgi:hypothetical protein
VQKFGQFGEPTGLNFSSLIRFADKLRPSQNYGIITIYEWTFKPNIRTQYIDYLRIQINDILAENYITDICYLMDKIAQGTDLTNNI